MRLVGTMSERARVRARKLGQALRRAVGRSRTLERGYRWLIARYRELSPETARLWARLGGKYSRNTGIRAENIIWILGSGRSGSTWLRSMVEDLDRHQAWEEPMVGQLFGEFYRRAHSWELETRSDHRVGEDSREGNCSPPGGVL